MSARVRQVVVMGGGTGTFPVISALKRIAHLEITSIVVVSDSGGSSGRIRDEFGFQPVGDLRQSLAALAESEGEEWIRKILLYRFSKGQGLQGHNLGNLLLTALQDMTGDTTEALEIAEKIFRLDGKVIPVTKDTVDLKINYRDGSSEIGEHLLDLNPAEPKEIAAIELVPPTRLNPLARQALLDADVIIIGPGDYYASLMAVLTPSDVKDVFKQVTAKIIYMMNLMTRWTQTRNMTAMDHVVGIEQTIGRKVDSIITNNQPISPKTSKLYAEAKEFPVTDDLDGDARAVRAAIISDELVEKNTHDTAHRSLLRHDQIKLQKVLEKMV